MDVRKRLLDLQQSLEEYKADDWVPWSTAKIYNALLEMAKTEYSDDPVVRELEPLERFIAAMTGPSDHADAKAGELRAAIRQILSALGGGTPPSL